MTLPRQASSIYGPSSAAQTEQDAQPDAPPDAQPNASAPFITNGAALSTLAFAEAKDDVVRPTQPELSRFLAKVDGILGDSDSCNMWLAKIVGPKPGNMHGMFWFRGKMRLSHRLAYVWFKGELLEGQRVGHTCRSDGRCVNPRHLVIKPPHERARVHLVNDHTYHGTDSLRAQEYCIMQQLDSFVAYEC
eukprot:TRINITY_DN1049_c0_g1_i1.p1 TRINITY_DN1049_c0_g1~~TRINITY_DN1049_c0_g1_i1.p1  ORF type:complete len:190 (-),score=7.38 TRINITY_DN1049_c0_g1_i1:1722-2291(-)